MGTSTDSIAQAVFEASGRPAQLVADLEQLAAVLNRVSLLRQTLIDVATRSTKEQEQTVRKYLGQFSQPVRELVAALVAERRLDDLPLIIQQLDRLVKRQRGVSRIVVETPSRIPTETRTAIAQRFGSDNITEVSKPSLIGGFRILIDDKVMDLSVAGSLDQLKQELTHA